MSRPRLLIHALTFVAMGALPLAAQQPPGGRAMRPAAMARMRQMQQMGEMQGMEAAMMPVKAYAPAALLMRREPLALTADQVTRLQALADEAKQAGEHAKADHDAHHAAVIRQFQQAVTDPAQVTQHAQAAMQAMTAGHVAELSAAAKAKGLLTAEQRARVDGRVDAMREMMRAGMPMGPMPGMRDSAGRGHEGH
jgi:hypothetical protein